MVYDAIIVGAGPGGASAATFLAGQGLSVLILDKADFPREKVCGDCLTPQAIYWLERLGCVDEVLSQSKSAIFSADLFINGEYVLTGRFPQDAHYPGFATLLERRTLDQILVSHAVSRGATFRPGHQVLELSWQRDSIAVEAESSEAKARFEGRLLIGADGASSIVSRSIGNALRNGTVAIAMRAYYQNVPVDGSQVRIYLDEQSFPGYGWVFVDDRGKANVGLGYAADRNFPAERHFRTMYDRYVQSSLANLLADATPIGQPMGWWTCFSRPAVMVADRVMLIGDAAQLADPMNGGGIHKAMESAYAASHVATEAIAAGDCSRRTLSRYERLWQERAELDWRTADLFLSIAKNPNLRELYLHLLSAAGRLMGEDRRFQDYCSGVFSGVLSQSSCLSPLVLFDVVPLDLGTWLSLLRTPNGARYRSPVNLAAGAARDVLRAAGRMVTDPAKNLDWGMEVLNKGMLLARGHADRLAASVGQQPG